MVGWLVGFMGFLHGVFCFAALRSCLDFFQYGCSGWHIAYMIFVICFVFLDWGGTRATRNLNHHLMMKDEETLNESDDYHDDEDHDTDAADESDADDNDDAMMLL